MVPSCLEADVVGGIADEKRERQSTKCDDESEKSCSFAKSVVRRDNTAEESGHSQGEISGEFVEPHGKPTSRRANEIDLHDDGHRPREALVDPEECIRRDDQPPRSRGEDEVGNW